MLRTITFLVVHLSQKKVGEDILKKIHYNMIQKKYEDKN